MKDDFLWFAGIILILFVLWIYQGGPNDSTIEKGLITKTEIRNDANGIDTVADHVSESGDVTDTSKSLWYKKIQIEAGVASGEDRAVREYIFLRAAYDLKEPVSLAGWSLENGRNLNLYDKGRQVIRGIPTRVIIPLGTSVFTGVSSVNTPIILKPGESAVIITGYSSNNDKPVKVGGSFKTNLCTGYIEAWPNREFYPNLSLQCPNPQEEPGSEFVSDDCYEFIKQIPLCHTPVFTEYKTIDGERKPGKYVDGVDSLSSTCRAFIKDHFSFQGCVKYHLNDPDFLGTEWRVYLGQTWELWARNRERITLYDQFGKIVDQYSY